MATTPNKPGEPKSASDSRLTAVKRPDKVFEHLGIHRVIHAGSTTHAIWKPQLSDRVWAAMRDACRSFYDVEDLNRAVSKFIAMSAGVESTVITSRATSALVPSIGTGIVSTGKSDIRIYTNCRTGSRPGGGPHVLR